MSELTHAAQAASEPSGSQQRVVNLRWIYRGWLRKCGVQVQLTTRSAIYAAGIAWAFPTFKHVRIGEGIQQYRFGPFAVGRKLKQANEKLTDAGTQASD